MTSLALRNRFTLAFEVSNDLNEVRNVCASERTARRWLTEDNIWVLRFAIAPELLVLHRQIRLQFARDIKTWWYSYGDKFYLPMTPELICEIHMVALEFICTIERFAQCTIISNTVEVPRWRNYGLRWDYAARKGLVIIDNDSLTAQRCMRTFWNLMWCHLALYLVKSWALCVQNSNNNGTFSMDCIQSKRNTHRTSKGQP